MLRHKTNGGIQEIPITLSKMRSIWPTSRQAKLLEGEIETAAHHAEVVLRAVYHVPAEIIDPADMRRDADFNATTELADQL